MKLFSFAAGVALLALVLCTSDLSVSLDIRLKAWRQAALIMLFSVRQVIVLNSLCFAIE